ncbi:hypothetical protein EDB87DRAFT_1686554 [Lactarius vividus]|nr:hypothetical protein EDB87DRAFT_1686554 [Lactarius vividus]
MSGAPQEVINIPDAEGIGDNQYPPQSAPTRNLASHGMSNFVDGSGPIFSMYLEMASEEDEKVAEGWKADADGILIFTGLFSAAVASLISVSIQDIRPNPQDTSNFYLANIYQAIADPNRPNTSLPSSPPSFSPPNYAVWVNSLWFMSLVISLTCALLATLLQQWARRYLKVTQPRYSPHKRARIRAFFAEGVDKFLLPWAVEALPTLLHVSLFLFFAGLVVFLCNVNLTIFKLVFSWVSVCMALYGCVTFTPIFRHDSPYYTPLSSPTWHMVTGITYVVFRILRRLTLMNYFSGETFVRFESLEKSYRKLLVQGMQKAAEGTALDLPSEIDTRAFLWTFDSLDEDHELEHFFAGLPGFRRSNVVDDPLASLTYGQKHKLLGALIGLLDRTFSSDLLPEHVKSQRAVICANAIGPADIPGDFWRILRGILVEDQYGVQSAEIGHFVRGSGDSGDGDDANTAIDVGAIVSSIVAKVQRRNDSWFILASNELGVPEYILRNYAVHGDSLSLAVLIHVVRQQFSNFIKQWPWYAFSIILEAASKFNVQDSSPELQHEFCALWNQIVLQARNDDADMMARFILAPIRNVYFSLHRDTAIQTLLSPSTSDHDIVLWDPSSYPVCNVADHIHGDSVLTTFARTVLHDNAVLASASLSCPDAHPSPVPSPCQLRESLTDVPPPDDSILYAPGSSQSAHHTAIENLCTPDTSPDPLTNVTTRTTLLSTPDILVSTLTDSTHPTGGVADTRHAENSHTPSEASDDPLSPFPALALDDSMLPTESHSLVQAPASPSPSRPRLSSSPDLGAAA